MNAFDSNLSHELFGRSVHTVNRIPVLFIGEGIKTLFMFFSPVKNKKKNHISLESSCKRTYLLFLFFFNCIYGFGILHIFKVLKSPFPTNKHFPSSSANLFGKLMLFCSLLMWFQFPTNKNVTTTVLLHVLQLGW